MASRTDIAKQWIEAQQSRDADKIKALGDLITEDAIWTTPRGAGSDGIVSHGKPARLRGEADG